MREHLHGERRTVGTPRRPGRRPLVTPPPAPRAGPSLSEELAARDARWAAHQKAWRERHPLKKPHRPMPTSVVALILGALGFAAMLACDELARVAEQNARLLGG